MSEYPEAVYELLEFIESHADQTLPEGWPPGLAPPVTAPGIRKSALPAGSEDALAICLADRLVISALNFRWQQGVPGYSLSAQGQKAMAMYRLGQKASNAPPAATPPTWNPPEGYVGVKDIMSLPSFSKKGKNPSRSIIEDWDKRSSKRDNPVKRDQDPASQEVYYPREWVFEQIRTWNPRP
jgi:hypothetical protein